MFANLLARSTRAYYEETLREDRTREAVRGKKSQVKGISSVRRAAISRLERAAS